MGLLRERSGLLAVSYRGKTWAAGENLGLSCCVLISNLTFSKRAEETWAFPNCSPSVCQKNPRPTETNWGQLTARLWANCNHYTSHRKFLQIVEKYRHKRISHLTLKSLAWDHNKNVPKDSRDLSHCSTQHSTQGLMTEGKFFSGSHPAALQQALCSPAQSW